jgi:hypothetical protein
MPEQLGRIERLEAEHYKKGRKLYVVPLVYVGQDAAAEYKEKCNRYWQQVSEQLTNLEAKIGKVNRVYHESIFQSGEDGIKAMERLGTGSYQITQTHRDNGATFETIEQRELFEEVLDWQRCLMLGFMSDKVANKVSEFYVEAARKRNEFVAKEISDTLKEDEAGLLFMREEHSVQFPSDIEVFSVFPPALDEIHRWLRDQPRAGVEKAANETKKEAEQKAERSAKKPRKRRKTETEE